MRMARRLTSILAGVMLVQSALGLLFRSAYHDVDWIATTWLGNDWVTLAVALPLLAASAWLATANGSPRPLLLWLGTLAYALYNYAYYLFGAALNAFFALYIAGVLAAALSLMLALSDVSPSDIARTFDARTPTRLVSAYFVFVGLALACIWMTTWAAHVFAARPTPIAPEAFKLVAALDMVFLVPTLTIGGAMLWRRRAWGYVVTTIAGVQASLYLLVLSINAVVFVVRGLAEAPGEIPIWGALALLTSAATVVLIGHVRVPTEV